MIHCTSLFYGEFDILWKKTRKLLKDIFTNQKSVIAYFMITKEYPIYKDLLTPIYCDEIKTVLFSANISKKKIDFIKQNKRGEVFFYSNRFLGCISLSGDFDILDYSDVVRIITQNEKKKIVKTDCYFLKLNVFKGDYYNCFKHHRFKA